MKLLLFIAAVAVVLFVIARFVPKGKTIALYAVLVIVAVVMLFPFYDMFVMSTRTTQEIFSFPRI